MARVLLGICGGIAAYKTPQLVRDLRAAGHEVRVVMTSAARHFVSELSLATVSQHPVRNALFELTQEADIGHIELARWPDIILIAPATADLLARMAHGRCDDLLTTVLLATRAEMFVAPAMNVQMWAHEATQRNVQTLTERGVSVLGPAHGELACGEQGPGKMLEPAQIVAALNRQTRTAPAQDWAGRRVVITAGPTREYLDGVRFISNPSTGTMGFALAAAVAQRGGQVDLVAGPVALETPAGVRRHDVHTGEEMFDACVRLLTAKAIDWVFKVAAVVDLHLPGAGSAKRDKSQWMAQAWQFAPTRDLLAELVQRFGTNTRFLGFAAQTAQEGAAQGVAQQILERARAKLKNKGCDAIFVNRVNAQAADRHARGFGAGHSSGYLIHADRPEDARGMGQDAPLAKIELAHAILDELVVAGAGPA